MSLARSNSHRWILAAILLVAFVLRAWNLDWDRGTHLQPDERFWSSVADNTELPDQWRWSEILDPAKSTLNPRTYVEDGAAREPGHVENYVYGTLPLWASEAAAAVLMTDAMAPVVEVIDGVGIDLLRDNRDGEPDDLATSERLRFDTGYNVNLIGRLMSVIIDTITVAMVFLLARELTDDNKVGLLAAFLQAFTVLHIQYTHFLGSEPWVALFVTCAVWGSVRLARGRGGWRTRAFTAVAVGFAIGSKLSGIASVAAPFAAALVVIGPDLPQLARRRIASGVIGRVARKVEPYLVMGLIAIVAYRVAQPYDFRAGISLVLNDRFSADIDYITDINSGGDWPWVHPLVGRTPLLHPLKQMILWGMGPGLGLAGVFGMARAARRFFLGERFWAVPLAVIGAYFLLVSLQFYAIIRYLQPAYPIITALTGAGLVAAWRWAGSVAPTRGRLARGVKIAVGLAVAITALWALAFVNGVYNNTNARLAAGDWMIANLPADAAVSQQLWDDGLPWGQASTFERITLEPWSFGGDAPDRIELLIQGLDQVDYVIESSNKFYDSLPRTPARFPQMTEYYKTLFDGSLGFELVKTFQNQPSLFGITIDDSGAEEAFTVYDHPTVLIWRKTADFSVERAYGLLNPDRARTAIDVDPRDSYSNAGMLLPAEYTTQQSGSSFRDVHSFDPSSPVAAVLWFALIQLLSFAVAPILMRSAGRAAGAVYGLAKPLAIVVLALPTWLLVSSGVVDMSRTLVVAMMFAIIAMGAWHTNRWRDRVREMWNDHKRLIIAAEIVFSGAFLIVLWLRANNPDLWHPWQGGEKPMELAYLSAVTGSTTMPPYDPWFAGGSLNYYYMGWFVLAVPIRILGLMPDVGFNLGVVTYAALAAVTIFSTAAMLAELARRRSTRLLAPEYTGLIAVVLFLVIGNLDGFRQLVTTLAPDNGYGLFGTVRLAVTAAAGLTVGVWVWQALKNKATMVAWSIPAGVGSGLLLFVVANLSGVRRVWSALPWQSFDFWDPSRVNKFERGVTCGGEGLAPCGEEVTEFPNFTVLFADLHPHFMAMTFFGLGLAGAIAFIERARQGRTGSTWLLAIGLGVGSGFVQMVHTWDLPTNALVVVGAIVVGWMIAQGPIAWRARYAVGQLVAAGLAHLVVTAPYRGRNFVADSGFKRSESVTNLDDWVAHWGLFLFVAVAYLAAQLWSRRAELVTAASAVTTSAIALAIVGFVALALSVGTVAAWAFVGLVAAGLLLVSELRQGQRSTPHVFVSACWALGFAVLVGVESFTQEADIARLNTVFKFWLQVWHLFAVAAAFGISWIIGGLRASAVSEPVAPTEAATPGVSSQYLRRVFAGGLVVLLLASLTYPLFAVGVRQDRRFSTELGPSLDGGLWLRPGISEISIRDVNNVDTQIDPGRDRALIDWLQANVDGRPTIVEAVGGSEYQWWGRMSIHTGLPTVLGWRWHQTQQRTIFSGEVNERKAEVAEFYTTESRARIDSFLRAFDVSYVIVGSLEVATANPRTLEHFSEHPSLVRVFSSGDLAIYEVDKASLAQSTILPSRGS